MIRRAVVLSPEALDDLKALYDRIADTSSEGVALAYLGRVQAHLRGFDLASERGSPRHHIRPGLRTIGFERRITIAFTVGDTQVTINRVFYGGQDWPSAF